jgi:hypothetical protein
MENKNKIILDLCGGTGAWSKPYADAGYDVRVVTLPEYDVRTCEPPVNVYGVLAAPPCTEFSVAKGNKPRDFVGGMEIVKSCLGIIWKCRQKGELSFWAIENPVGFLRQFLGIPHFSFKHWQYGDLQIKPTDVWGYFNEPKPTVKYEPELLTKTFPNGQTNGRGWANPPCPQEYKHLGLTRADLRSITPPGFARAFFEANQ